MEGSHSLAEGKVPTTANRRTCHPSLGSLSMLLQKMLHSFRSTWSSWDLAKAHSAECLLSAETTALATKMKESQVLTSKSKEDTFRFYNG